MTLEQQNETEIKRKKIKLSSQWKQVYSGLRKAQGATTKHARP